MDLIIQGGGARLQTHATSTFGLVPVTPLADTLGHNPILRSPYTASNPVGGLRSRRQQSQKEIKEMETNEIMIETVNENQKSEKGVTTVEYAVMLVLVAIAVLATGTGIAGSVTGVFSRLATSL
jgi:Flp pilus assembly pilin Flp